MDNRVSAFSVKPPENNSSIVGSCFSTRFDSIQDENEMGLMIVDATNDSRMELAQLLRGKGYKVRTADSGETAIRLANQFPLPSLILLDIMMPGVNGERIFGRLRDSSVTRDIPVIFIIPGEYTDVGEHGFGDVHIDFIEKPFKPWLVLARVRNSLFVQRAQHLLRCNGHRTEFRGSGGGA